MGRLGRKLGNEARTSRRQGSSQHCTQLRQCRAIGRGPGCFGSGAWQRACLRHGQLLREAATRTHPACRLQLRRPCGGRERGGIGAADILQQTRACVASVRPHHGFLLSPSPAQPKPAEATPKGGHEYVVRKDLTDTDGPVSVVYVGRRATLVPGRRLQGGPLEPSPLRATGFNPARS